MDSVGKVSPETLQLLEQRVIDIAKRLKLPRVTVALRRGDWFREIARGPSGDVADATTSKFFTMGCLPDMIVAIVCLELVSQGKLDLSAPVSRWLPDIFGVLQDNIEIRHLLARTSGLRDPRSSDEMRRPMPFEDIAERLRPAAPQFSPGVAFSYGGIDRLLLSTLMERATGQAMERLGRDTIIAPRQLEMHEDQLGAEERDGVRQVTRFNPAKLTKVLCALCDGAGGADGLFAAYTRERLITEELALSRSVRAPPAPHAAVAFTSGQFRYSNGLFGFTGWDAGDGCAVRYDPVRGLAIVVAVEGPPPARDLLINHISDLLGYISVQSRAKPCLVGALNGVRQQELAGDYDGWARGYAARITQSQNTVECQLSHEGEVFRSFALAVEDDEWLVSPSVDVVGAFEFFRDSETGRVGFSCEFSPYAKAI